MTAHQVLARIPTAETAAILEWLQDNDRAAYKTCAGLLATRRKLRPVFIERKPKGERNAWMAEALGKPASSDMANEILQSWVLGANGKMVCEFLDSLKIPHDGHGLIETLPPEPAAGEVDSAVETLFANHPATAVLIYLNLFVSMEMAEWPHLANRVSSDPRICPNPTNL